MKSLLLSIACLLSSCVAWSQYEDIKYISPDYEFEKGSTALMYGDNVVLRAGQGADSEALDTLQIGDRIQIIKKGETTTHLNGRPSYWYKVKANHKTGYVLGGWISLDYAEMDGKTFLIIYAERNNELFMRTRVLSPDKTYYGHEIPLSTSLISLKVNDGKGLTNVEHMAEISMHADACGVVGGTAYLFDNGSKLFEAFRVSSMSEAGLFWFAEELDFKGPDYWEENIVYYSIENGEYMDDSLDWTQTVTNTVKMTWNGEAFVPDARKMNFESKEVE